jgi:catechol 2,3-dioxygenase-like lactoylglutathione lyase family enzyme
MKRMHLHVSVPDLAESISFYETLFGASPSVVKADYAKWMLDDPRVNFAISQRAAGAGVDHIGIQVESADELGDLAGRLKAAGAQTFDETATTCCYAVGDKSWVRDPSGVRWETFFTYDEATTYGEDRAAEAATEVSGGCCGAASKVAVCC